MLLHFTLWTILKFGCKIIFETTVKSVFLKRKQMKVSRLDFAYSITVLQQDFISRFYIRKEFSRTTKSSPEGNDLFPGKD